MGTILGLGRRFEFRVLVMETGHKVMAGNTLLGEPAVVPTILVASLRGKVCNSLRLIGANWGNVFQEILYYRMLR